MFALLEKVIQDFEEEIDTLKDEAFSILRSTLKRVLQSLQMLDAAVLDGYGNDPKLHLELSSILREAENELGALLRSDRSLDGKSDHVELLKCILIRINEYRGSFSSSSSVTTNSFCIPLFTRSDSFKSVKYEPSDARNVPPSHDLRNMSIQIDKETIKASLNYRQMASASRNSKSSIPRPPPPPVSSKESCGKKKKKPEIARQPTVLKLFHSFRSRTTSEAPSQNKMSNSKIQKGDPTAVIAELMSKSKHAQKINREVEMHSEKIKNWANEITTRHFNSMEEVDAFVQSMDKDINETLTDEVIILKKVGNWPKRYDILREARASWKQLKDMEAKMLNWKMNDSQNGAFELERIQKFLEGVDDKLQGIMRFQQREEKKYGEAGIPWSHLQYDRVKAAALVPIEIYLKTVLTQAARHRSFEKQRQLFSKCAVFAFKGHQFVGGFNEACSRAFALVERAAHSVIDGPEQKDLNHQCLRTIPVAFEE